MEYKRIYTYKCIHEHLSVVDLTHSYILLMSFLVISAGISMSMIFLPVQHEF